MAQATGSVRGRVTSVPFRRDKTGETIARIAPEGNNPTKASYPFWGNFASSFTRNEIVTVSGIWVNHPSFGRTLKVDKLERTPPSTRDGEISFLVGGIQGMTKVQATKLLSDADGLQNLIRVIREEPAKIDTWLPKAKKVRERLKGATWTERSSDVDASVGLRSAGLRADQIKTLTTFFGGPGLRQAAQQNPYEFCQVPNIGFKSAEKVALFYAKAQGRIFDYFHLERLIYGMCDAVAKERMDGHVCMPVDKVLKATMHYLDLPKGEKTLEDLQNALNQALSRRLLIKDLDMIYTRGLYKAEQDLAMHLGKILLGGARPLSLGEEEIVALLEDSDLSPEQKQAVAVILTSPVSILVGGPGRGKTHTLRSAIRLIEQNSKSVLLLAPTGKAAKRVSEVTGRPCATIHKACGLEHDEDVRSAKYGKGRKKRLPQEVVVVDEMSMVDLTLAFELVRRIRAGRTALILLGDPDQLPPIGPGQVLKDLIASGRIPVARLNTVYRQAKNSPIIKAADALNAGRLPEFLSKGHELRIFDPSKSSKHPRREGEKALQFEIDLIQKWLKQGIDRYVTEENLDVKQDIQVYAPQKSGPLGVDRLNALLQDHLNPLKGRPTGPKLSGGLLARTGDKVMQVQNNYHLKMTGADEEIQVMNGQIGWIASYSAGKVEVQYPDLARPVVYEGSNNLSQLAIAYAISIHRSQGSETPYAFLVLHRSMHPRLMGRSLIYTAATRAQKGVAFFCPANDLQKAILNTNGAERYTALAKRMQQVSLGSKSKSKK